MKEDSSMFILVPFLALRVAYYFLTKLRYSLSSSRTYLASRFVHELLLHISFFLYRFIKFTLLTTSDYLDI